jgi:hypothetical protein
MADVVSLGAAVTYCDTIDGSYAAIDALKFDQPERKRKVVEKKAIGDGNTPGGAYPGRTEPGKIKITLALDKTSYGTFKTAHLAGSFFYWRISWPSGGITETWYGWIERIGEIKWEDDPSKIQEVEMDIQTSGDSVYDD